MANYPGHYQYDYFLPAEASESISQAVENFAKQEATRSYDSWYHGLPVWIVRGKDGNRVNRVQIGAVVIATEDGEPYRIISFTPDAYEDKISYENGVKRVERKTPPADIVKKRSQSLDLDLNQAKKTNNITEYLKKAWSIALELPLKDEISWEHVTPFK